MATQHLILIHGAWHNGSTWHKTNPFLERPGLRTHMLDLPGAGALAQQPKAVTKQPRDAIALASEASPNAGVTQAMRSQAVIDLIRDVAEPEDSVFLVGHSLGGLTVSDVAEQLGERLSAVVYLTAFMLPPDMPAIAMIQHESMAGEEVAPLFLSDPAETGALRLDPGSDDPDYRARLVSAFYGDLAGDQASDALRELHSDEPASVALTPSLVTPASFGQLARHYIRCTEDRAIPITGQDYMIAAVDAALGGKTFQHTLHSSHSPFFSQPERLAEILLGIVDSTEVGR